MHKVAGWVGVHAKSAPRGSDRRMGKSMSIHQSKKESESRLWRGGKKEEKCVWKTGL